MDENKKRALSAALTQIERQFGKGSVMRMGDRVIEPVEIIPTGSLMLDLALGIGGLPKGRVVEIYGPESSGKTTLTLQAIAECQKQGGTAAFIDAEHALDPVYAAKLGVNVDDLLLSQPDTGEQALEIADMLVRSGSIDIVVIDSVAALTPKAEIEGEMGDQLPGLQARLMSQALRKLTGNIKRSNTLVVFINQLRMKIGVMMPGQSPETTTGGNALKFYASVRLDIRRIGAIKKGDEIIGNQTKIKVVKNKLAPPSSRSLPKSCTAKASAARVNSSIWVLRPSWSTKPALGMAMAVNASARARTMRGHSCARTRPLQPSWRQSFVRSSSRKKPSAMRAPTTIATIEC